MSQDIAGGELFDFRNFKFMNESELKIFEEKEIERITQKTVSVIRESKTLTNKQVNKIIDEE